jgi:hypothetical protein
LGPISTGSSPENDIHIPREATHQMLRALEHKVPRKCEKQIKVGAMGSLAEGSASNSTGTPAW